MNEINEREYYQDRIDWCNGRLESIEKDLKWIKEQIKLDKKIGHNATKLYTKLRRDNYKWRKTYKENIEHYTRLLNKLNEGK